MTASPPIRRWAQVLNILSILAIVIVVLVIGAAVLLGQVSQDIRVAARIAPEIELSHLMGSGLALLGALPAAAMVYVLAQMGALFRCYCAGETLTPRCARHIRRIGGGILVMAALGAVVRPVQILLASLGNPPGDRVLAIGFGSMDLAAVLAGGLLLTIGWAMADAVRAAQENAEIV